MKCFLPCAVQRKIQIMVCRQDSLNSADAIVSPSAFSPNTALHFDSPPSYEECTSKNKLSEKC